MANEDEQMPWERYRLAAQSDEISAEGRAPGSAPYLGGGADRTTKPEQGDSKQDATKIESSRLSRLRKSIPKPLKVLTLGEWVVVAVSVIGLVAAILVYVRSAGPQNVGIFALVALLPLTLVAVLVLWADRYASLRMRYLIVGALWGGGVATTIAAILNSSIYSDFIATLGDVATSETRTAVFIAPVTEELFKGAGVILIMLFASRYVVSATNGLVLAATVGAAFAYVENIQYFLQAQYSGSSVLGMTIFARAILSPFVHPMATSFIGFFCASAMLKRAGVWGWTWRLGVGFLIAILLHGLWNGLANFGSMWLLFYTVVELPLFIAWLVWVLVLAGRQRWKIQEGLAPYLATGWVSSQEVNMVCNRDARRYARKWARKVGGGARRALRKYLVAAGRLGSDQVNMQRTGPDQTRVQLAREELVEMENARTRFLELGELHVALSR